MKKFFFLFLFFLFLGIWDWGLGIGDLAYSQCAMCRAVAESTENSITKGLNTGILYLLAVPYILLGAIAIYFFRKQIKEKIKMLKS